MKTSLIIMAVFLCSAFTFKQQKTISGNWIGELTIPDGSTVPLNYTFKVDNGILTGSSQGTQKDYPISDGKIVGDSIYFAITVDNGSQIINAGKYYRAGDSISLKETFMGADMHGVVKRNLTDN